MSNNVSDLRDALFDVLKGLKNGTISVETAKASSEVAQTIINTAKVEVEFARTTGTKSSAFLEQKEKLPPGITGVTVHRISG
jgi:hypothetical protein